MILKNLRLSGVVLDAEYFNFPPLKMINPNIFNNHNDQKGAESSNLAEKNK
ncbi:MAG: hypothetical protein V3S48_04800 [Candidatus Neomarinimicrobiota bacterium]